MATKKEIALAVNKVNDLLKENKRIEFKKRKDFSYIDLHYKSVVKPLFFGTANECLKALCLMQSTLKIN